MKAKPEWKDLPTWANFLAQDQDGDWAVFELAPVVKEVAYWLPQFKSKFNTVVVQERNGIQIDNWKESLEFRPEVKDA